ncbi:hypothetical protein [Nitrososphaera viennensis]|uniref:Uncharacterized protein n=1 Tax=Nitrososphaera viennensis TaxID=1034015 RepID=A0A977NLQ4_9ARCH|nr:hypothetical protein [Nitrososphaera viennensis]UVS68105.1 hypothetical protein NWT39_09355 [Nitrososphaera viennensis]
MSDEGDSDYDIIARALGHLAKRLESLKTDELVKIGNGVMIKDLDAHADRCNQLRQKFIDKTAENLIRYNLGLICNALAVYHKDLESSKKALSNNLFGGQQDIANFELKHLDKEMRDVAYLLDYYKKKGSS